MITDPLLNAAILGVIAIQLGRVLLFLNRLVIGHWLASPGSPGAVRSDLRRLQRTAARSLGTDPAATALLGRLRTVEQDLATGHDGATAEAAPWLQWEVLSARAQGRLARGAAAHLIDDARALCEDLWARARRGAMPRALSGA